MTKPVNENNDDPVTEKSVTVRRPLAFNKSAIRAAEDVSASEIDETVRKLAEARRHDEARRRREEERNRNTKELISAITNRAPPADVRRLLKEENIDLYTYDDGGNGLLHLAVRYNNLDALAALIDHGLNLHMKNLDGVTPLMVASAGYDTCAAAVMLADADPDLSAHVMEGVHPIHFAACGHNKTRLLEKLLERGVSPTLEDPEGHTPLYHAIFSKRGDAAEVICMAGGFRQQDMPELQKAIAQKQMYCKEFDYDYLLERVGQLDSEALRASFPKSGPRMPPVPDALTEEVFHTAKGGGSSFRMEKFGGNHEALNKRNHDGQTVLMALLDNWPDVWAARGCNWGSDRSARDNAGRTHLHYAVRHVSCEPMVDMHLCRETLDAQDMLGRTPLMVTVDGCNYLERLMRSGADLSIRDRLGLTAKDIAKVHKCDYALDLIEKEEARRKQERKQGGPAPR